MKIVFCLSLAFLVTQPAMAGSKNHRVPSSASAQEKITITGSKADQIAGFLGAGDCGAGKCTNADKAFITCTGKRSESDDGDVNRSKDNTCVITHGVPDQNE